MKTGSVDGSVPLRKPTYRLALFWSFVDKSSECWLWDSEMLDVGGYGTAGSRKAHRVAYEMLKGPIPKGMQLDHLCHTRDKSCRGGPTCLHRRCVNPAHLEPVTNKVNCERGRAGDRVRERAAMITHCPRGHSYVDEPRNKWGGCAECNRERSRAKSAKSQGLPDPRRKITDQQIAEIFRLAGLGVSQGAIGRQVGVSGPSVCRVLNGKQRV